MCGVTSPNYGQRPANSSCDEVSYANYAVRFGSLRGPGVRKCSRVAEPDIPSSEFDEDSSAHPGKKRRRTPCRERLPGHPDPGETFILKVDPKNGGSSHLVFMTGDLGPRGEIVTHRHPGADKFFF